MKILITSHEEFLDREESIEADMVIVKTKDPSIFDIKKNRPGSVIGLVRKAALLEIISDYIHP